jgi:predicted O-methyltransferase YrrM
MNKIDKTIYENLVLLPQDLQGWNGNSTVFGDLIKITQPKTVIEVGSWKGQSAINMAKHIKANNLDSTIHCVDTWLGAIEFWERLANSAERNLLLKNGYPQIYYQFLSNVVHNNMQDVILPFPNTSENGFRYFKSTNVKAQLIYIDASHEEEDVYKDVRNYFQLLDEGGIIFGDDYNKSWPGVVNSVNKFAEEKMLTVQVLEDNFWVIKK